MEIIENKALLLKLRDPEKVTAVIPKSRVMGEHNVLVHWGLDEAQVLKNLKIKNVPSPILRSYAWPGLYKPFKGASSAYWSSAPYQSWTLRGGLTCSSSPCTAP